MATSPINFISGFGGSSAAAIALPDTMMRALSPKPMPTTTLLFDEATGELVMQSVMADDEDGERLARVRDPSLVAFDDDWMLDGIDGKTLLGTDDDADADAEAEDGRDAVMPGMAALAIGDAPEDDADKIGKTGLGRLVEWAGAFIGLTAGAAKKGDDRAPLS